MKIWSDDKEDDESAKKYVQPSKDDFEQVLEYTPWDWSKAEDVDAGEIVYESSDFLPEHSGRVVRVFSTIEKRGGKARSKGSDAIRTVIWDKDVHRPVGGQNKTLRIRTWRNNLLDKLHDLADETSEYMAKCGQCGSLMVIRDGQYGKFYGCREYPDCQNTRQLEE